MTVWRNTIRDDNELTAAATLVGLVIAAYANARGVCWPTVEQIAAGAKKSETTVYRAIAELESRLYLSRSPGRSGRATRYQLLLGAF